MSAEAQAIADALWGEYLSPDANVRDIEEVLFLHYKSLADYLAKRALLKAPPYQDREDIFSYAHHGLIDAIRRFDPSQGVKFETYATRRISGAIIDWQRRQDPLTRPMRRRVKQMSVTEAALRMDGREPSVAEVADAMGASQDEVRELRVIQQSLAASIEATLEASEGSTAGIAALNHDAGLEVNAQELEFRDRVVDLLERLDDVERTFVVRYYGEKRKLKDIAQILGVHESRVSQIRDAVIRKMAA